MEALDKKMQEVLSKKFEGAEMDVDPSIWEGINSSLQPGIGGAEALVGGGKGVLASWTTWVAASVLVVGTLTWAFWPVEAPIAEAIAPVTQEEVQAEEKAEVIQEKLAEIVENRAVVVLEEETSPPISVPVEVPPVVESTTIAPDADELAPGSVDQANDTPDGNASTSGETAAGEASPELSKDPDPLESNESTATPDPAVTQQVEEAGVHEVQKGNGVVRPLPNVFSPNGDGVNDGYLPKYLNPRSIHFRVVSMTTGEIVFESTQEQAWEGRDRSGQELPAGAYLYIVELIDENGVTDEATQLVRLFR